jgi:hypothetical protein
MHKNGIRALQLTDENLFLVGREFQGGGRSQLRSIPAFFTIFDEYSSSLIEGRPICDPAPQNQS